MNPISKLRMTLIPTQISLCVMLYLLHKTFGYFTNSGELKILYNRNTNTSDIYINYPVELLFVLIAFVISWKILANKNKLQLVKSTVNPAKRIIALIVDYSLILLIFPSMVVVVMILYSGSIENLLVDRKANYIDQYFYTVYKYYAPVALLFYQSIFTYINKSTLGQFVMGYTTQISATNKKDKLINIFARALLSVIGFLIFPFTIIHSIISKSHNFWFDKYTAVNLSKISKGS